MIEDLLPVLGAAGLRPDARELCDALWLASHVRAAPAAPAAPDDAGAASAEASAAPPDPAPAAALDSAAGGSTAGAALHAAGEGGGAAGVPAMEVRGPAVPALRHPLRLARALRPFKRRVPDPGAFVVDERATAARIAEEGLWSPVLRPAPRRWLDLTLVVDAAPTMVVWRRTVAELRALTEQLGAFRTVRVLHLHAPPDPAAPVLLFPEGHGGRVGAGLPPRGPDADGGRAPASLDTGAGGQAVLVVTDTVGAAWHDGRLEPVLRGWAAGAPLAVVTVLPQRMWSGAGVRAVPAVLRAPFPGAANAALDARVGSRVGAGARVALDVPVPDVPVPVLELSERWLAQWADVVAGASGWRNAALLVPEAAPVRPRTPRPAPGATRTAGAARATPAAQTSGSPGGGTPGGGPAADPAADPAAVVRRFRAAASPTAFRLACCLSAAWLNLPVMRLVQRVALPESDTSHLAEVYLGGLLTASAASAGTDPEQVAYDFLPGVRAELNQYLTRHDLVDILERTSAFVSERFGQPLDFPALLADPESAELPVRTGGGPPLAYVAASVLSQLGGRYSALASRLPRAATPTAGAPTAGAPTAPLPAAGPLDAAPAQAAGPPDTAPAPTTPAEPATPATPAGDLAARGPARPASSAARPASSAARPASSAARPTSSGDQATDPAAARPAAAPREASDRGLCLTFELGRTARSPEVSSRARATAGLRLRELLARAMADEGILGTVTHRREDAVDRVDLVVALGARQSALREAARLLLALAPMVGEPHSPVREVVWLPIGVAITVGTSRDGATGFSTSAHRQARSLLTSMTTVRAVRAARVRAPDSRNADFPFEIAVSETVYGVLLERLGSVDPPSRRSPRPVDEEVRLPTGHLLADPRGVLEAVAGPLRVPAAATRAPRVFLSTATDDAETRRRAKELRQLLVAGGVDIAERSDRPDRPSASDWHDRLVQQMRRCERILVVASARPHDGAGGSSGPFQEAEEQLVRVRSLDADRVLGVVLPGSSASGLPRYLRDRQSFVLSSLTPSGVAPLLHHLLYRRSALTGDPDDGDTAGPPAAERAVARAAAAEQDARSRPEETRAEAQASPVALRSRGDGDDDRPDEGPYLGSFPAEASRHLDLGDDSAVVRRAREFTERALRDWGWPESEDAAAREAFQDVLLVVSELVANAVRYARPPYVLHLQRGTGAVRIEVEDGSAGDPVPRAPDPQRSGGHGLFIVQRLCLDWGVRHGSGRTGKTVWAEVADGAARET